MTPSSDTYSITMSLCISLGSPLAEGSDGFVDAPLPGLRCLGAFDREDKPLFVAVRQAVEETLCLWHPAERGLEVGRHRHFAGLGVEFEVDVHLVAGGDSRLLTHRCADRKHEAAAHRGDA